MDDACELVDQVRGGTAGERRMVIAEAGDIRDVLHAGKGYDEGHAIDLTTASAIKQDLQRFDGVFVWERSDQA